jgi:hypothetical protein
MTTAAAFGGVTASVFGLLQLRSSQRGSGSSSSGELNVAALRELVPQLLAVMPTDWRGTTFDNSNLLGREVFSQRLLALLKSKVGTKVGGAGAITQDELLALGNAEDYLRVATNLCTVSGSQAILVNSPLPSPRNHESDRFRPFLRLTIVRLRIPSGLVCMVPRWSTWAHVCIIQVYENVVAIGRGMTIEQVFSFSSRAMPVIAVALTCGAAVHLYHGSAAAPFSAAECATLALLAANVTCHSGAAKAHPGAVVLALEAVVDAGGGAAADGIVGDCVLFIANGQAIDRAKILTIRKRMAIPGR